MSELARIIAAGAPIFSALVFVLGIYLLIEDRARFDAGKRWQSMTLGCLAYVLIVFAMWVIRQ